MHLSSTSENIMSLPPMVTVTMSIDLSSSSVPSDTA